MKRALRLFLLVNDVYLYSFLIPETQRGYTRLFPKARKSGETARDGDGRSRQLCRKIIQSESKSNKQRRHFDPVANPSLDWTSIKQAILVFINAKLSINPDHRFAFSTLAKTASWLRKEFSSDVESAAAALRGLSAASALASASSSGPPDLTQLFRVAAHEAKKSYAQNRILRVILIYCRSSVQPQHQWPVSQKLFTLDVMYLHDKPGPDNCPQEVYDALVDTLEHVSQYEGYIHETGQGVRILLRYMSVLLSHPQQRCTQDMMDLPKSLTKRSPTCDPANCEEGAPISSQ
ncbi:hypothetical protein NC653_040386 [Populus alba x Populus x berolinensis]|uniref:Uncharacterized protein n=1 Tax=Populus alba x Populus x berolinensis TaxID=444605 RepID=A0AAD6LDM8_9ROSI|nr:hypothetical protein NC653_040386 [Populus alba x Populus x berolinensis]